MIRYTVPSSAAQRETATLGIPARWQTAWERLPPDWPGAIMVLGIAGLVPFVAAALP